MASKPRYATDKTLQALMARLDDLEARVSSQTIAAGTVTAVDTTAGTAQVQVAGGAETTMYATSGAPYLPQVGDKVMVHLSDGDAVSVAPRQMVDGDLRSSNFNEGSDGWMISGDGDAEFNSVVVRGTVLGSTIIGGTIETAETGQRIFLGTHGSIAVLMLYSGDGDETFPAQITNADDASGNPQLYLSGPSVSGHAGASMVLRATDALPPYTDPLKSVQVIGDQFVLGSSDLMGAWTEWTPALSGFWSVGAGVNWQRYKQIGKTMFVRGRVYFGAGFTVDAGGIHLEVQEIATAQSRDGFQCGSWVAQIGGASYVGIAKIHPTDELGNIQFHLPNGTNLAASNPAAWIATDFVDYSIMYEIA